MIRETMQVAGLSWSMMPLGLYHDDSDDDQIVMMMTMTITMMTMMTMIMIIMMFRTIGFQANR